MLASRFGFQVGFKFSSISELRKLSAKVRSVGTKSEQANLRRRFRIGFLVCFLVFSLAAVALYLRKPRAIALSGRKVSFSVQVVARSGPFSDKRLWVHDEWDGPTGELTHGNIYGLK